MPTNHSTSSIEAIMEEPEDASPELPLAEAEAEYEDPPCEALPRHQEHQRSHEPETRASMSKGRSRKNRSQGNKASKAKAKNMAVKRAPVGAPRDFDAALPRARVRRNVSNRSASSSSSSGEEEEEEQVEDHRTALARARLTSPSMVSSITTLTTATNKSSSSSGSNSTVTQSSVTKRSHLGRRAEVEDAPLSPAAPDPPNMFTFVDDDPPLQQEPDSDEEEDEDEAKVLCLMDEDIQFPEGTTWPKPRALMETAYEEPVAPHNTDQASASSSASSSFHGDDSFSEQPADHDTDRSTSPEGSDHGKDVTHAPAPNPPGASDEHSVKIASQIAAARHRQNSWGSMQQSEAPEIPQRGIQRSHAHSTISSSRSQHQVSQRPPPRLEDIPVTGYELLATKLSSSGFDIDGGPRIKPIYRKFEALNHRLLLHLQDELSELEDQLQRIDIADTQSRSINQHIVPASRRAAAQAGGELEWHKTDILGRIGFKLNQYNQALASFNSTQSLSPPHPAEIEDYREYLYAEQPITETETHFLDPEEDLVSVSRHEKKRRHHHRTNSFESGSIVPSVLSHSAISSRASMMHTRSMPPSPSTLLHVTPSETTQAPKAEVVRNSIPILAGAISITVLFPILSFLVIPSVLGRVIVTILVALSATGGLLLAHLVETNVLISQEGAMCASLYGGVMLVIAGVMGVMA